MIFISKTVKILLTSIVGILLLLILTTLILIVSIRGEFTTYLDEKYPDMSFKVSFTKYNVINESFYANVTCLEDGTFFTISKSFKTKDIYEDYAYYKSQIQYNSKIESIFFGSDIQSYIENVKGGGKTSFTNEAVYNQINIHLTDEADRISVVKKALSILKEKNISADTIMFTHEKNKGVYELLLSSDDYTLTPSEIEAKVKKIK